MTKDEAVLAAQAWLREKFGPDMIAGGNRLRVIDDAVVKVAEGWHVPYNTVASLDEGDIGKSIFPIPALIVPEDGGAVRRDQPTPPAGPPLKPMTTAPSWWPRPMDSDVEWARERPGALLPAVDPEYDREAFGYLGIPTSAILGWRRIGPDGTVTDQALINDRYRPGPFINGYPAPKSALEKLLAYDQCRWLDKDSHYAGFLDVRVLIPLDEHGGGRTERGPNGTTWVAAYSSTERLPATAHWWFEAEVRQLLTESTLDEVRINPDYVLTKTVSRSMVESYQRYPPRKPPAAVTDHTGPEVSAELFEVIDQIAKDAEHVERLRAGVRSKAEAVRENGYVLTYDECEQYVRAAAWIAKNGSDDQSPQPGMAIRYDDDGVERPATPSFGKSFSLRIPGARHGWHRVVGAYVGFALGDALGAPVALDSFETIQRKFGPAGIIDLETAFSSPGQVSALTQLLLHYSEGVLRGVPGPSRTSLPDSVAPAVRHALQRWLSTQGVPWAEASGGLAQTPDGLLFAVRELHARRAPDIATMSAIRALATDSPQANSSQGIGALVPALPAAVAGGSAHWDEAAPYARAMTGLTHAHSSALASSAVLSQLLFEALNKDWGHLGVITAIRAWLNDNGDQSRQTELLKQILSMSQRRDEPIQRQLDSIDNGKTAESALGRALLAVTKCGTDPKAALLAAVNHSGHSAITGAVAGAFLGARYGIAGLPTEWVDRLQLRYLIENLAGDLFWTFTRFSPREDYLGYGESWQRRYPQW